MDESKKQDDLSQLLSQTHSRESATPELVFGLVGPLGCNIDAVQAALVEELRRVKYRSKIIHITKYVKDVLPGVSGFTPETYSGKIDLMNEVVEASGSNDFLARMAIANIAGERLVLNSEIKGIWRQLAQVPGQAYIIRQLKRSQEVDLLRVRTHKSA